MNNQFAQNTQLQSAVDRSVTLPSTDRVTAIKEILLELPLIQEPLERLKNELPGNLAYHNLSHTNDVMTKVIELALADGLPEKDLTLLAIAAAWHDTGFIQQQTKNEPIAAAWVKEAMIKNGSYTEGDIEDVVQAILDTQVQFNLETKTLYQKSTGRLSPWLLDADLGNFGQSDFLKKSLQVFAEFSGNSINSALDMQTEPGRMFVASTIRFMDGHNWHSNAAQTLLAEQKAANIYNLGVLLAQMMGGAESEIAKVSERMLK